MKVFWKSFLFFIFCLAIAITALFPLRLALQYVQLPPDVKILGASGSVFSGTASQLSFRKVPFHNVRYAIGWNCVLQLSVCLDTSFDEGSLILAYSPISGKSEILSGDIKLSLQTPGLLPTNLLIKPQGDIAVRSISASVINQKLSDIAMVAEWQNAGIEGEQASLGDYQFTVSKQSSQYDVEITDTSGLLDVKGKGLLNAKSQYSVNLQISTRPGLQSSYKNAIELIAKKKKTNRYELKKTGKIPKPIVTYLSFGAG